MRKTLQLFLLLLVYFTCIQAQTTSYLDTGFGNMGIVLQTFPNSKAFATCVDIQTDEKIVVGGYFIDTTTNNYTSLLFRYLPNGNLDPLFGFNGIVILDSLHIINDITINNNEIWVAGIQFDPNNNYYSTIKVAKLLPTGALDNSFASNGIASFSLAGQNNKVNSILIANNKVFLGGTSNTQLVYVSSCACYKSFTPFLFLSYNMNGTPNASFANNGVAMIVLDSLTSLDGEVTDMAVQPTGEIVAAGTGGINPGTSDYITIRLLPNGTLDTTFNHVGFHVLQPSGNSKYDDNATSITLQVDNKILVGGMSFPIDTTNMIVRYLPNGQLDNTFGVNGKFFSPANHANYVVKVIYSNNNTIWGILGHLCMVKLQPNGTPDLSFDNDGYLTNSISLYSPQDAAMQPDGKIIVVGSKQLQYGSILSNFFIARYFMDVAIGVIDFIKDENAVYLYPNPLENNLRISYELLNTEIIEVSLYNEIGSKIAILQPATVQNKGLQTLDIPLPNLSKGNYFVCINNHEKSVFVRVIK